MNVANSRLFTLLDDSIIQSDIFQKAITHRSASKKNNERLEFLGDSVLNLVITEYLFRNIKNTDEGGLSRLRAYLVKGVTLAELAQENDLGDCLMLGEGELRSGGFRRDSIMEDALEAVFGAVYLLKGFEFTRNYILALFSERLEKLPEPQKLKDPKSRLQEWLQSNAIAIPDYSVLDISGEAHKQIFRVSCEIPALDIITYAKGSSRRKAEQQAAEAALALIPKKNSKASN